MANRRRPVLPRSKRALDALKQEVSRELGLDDEVRDRGWENMTTRQVGRIGGQMVRQLVRRGEEALAREEGDRQ
jgi:small acid-soluble spore protein F (minor alpha/beta-type SASP)